MQDPELIIYGGAFDPPHQGHIDCVEAAAMRFPASQIWITPAAQPAGASGQHKNPTVAFEHRHKLCELAFAPLIAKFPGISISSVERNLPPPNFTIRTLAWIKGTAGFRTFALLMGQDQFASFDRWRAPEEILNSASLVVVTRRREGQLAGPPAEKSAAEVFGKMGLTGMWQENDCAWSIEGKTSLVFLIEKEISEAESSALRAQLLNASPIREGWLPARVLEYIVSHQLFKESHL